MKLIKLLEKIEKGENLPKRIKYDGNTYDLDVEYRDYRRNNCWYLSTEIGNCEHFDKLLKNEVKVLNDKIRIKLKEHIDIYDLSQNHWDGCRNNTLRFLDVYYGIINTFEIDEDCVCHDYYFVEGYHVNKKCFDVID